MGLNHWAPQEYRRQIMDGRPVTAIRDLLDFCSDRQPVPLAEVAPRSVPKRPGFPPFDHGILMI